MGGRGYFIIQQAAEMHSNVNISASQETTNFRTLFSVRKKMSNMGIQYIGDIVYSLL